MLDARHKSIEPMAARLSDSDEQCLQQFVSHLQAPAAARNSLPAAAWSGLTEHTASFHH